MKDVNDYNNYNNTKPFRFIILYYEIKDNLGNEIDFILNINDKNEREEAENYILTNNLWKYFEKINYNFKQEYKVLYNKYKKEIGYIVRCCSDVSRIEQYNAKTISKKQNLFQNVPNIPKIQIGFPNNFSNNISNPLTSINIKNMPNPDKQNAFFQNNIQSSNNFLQNPQQNFNLQNNNDFLQNQIYILNNQLLQEKNNSEQLKRENEQLKNLINSLTQKNEVILVNIKQYENEINRLREKIQNLENEKNNIIQNYEIQIKTLIEDKKEIKSIKPGEKIFSVLFMTQGNNDINNYAMSCKNTDLFVRLEEKLYDDYPEYKNYETFFMVNTRRILRFKTMDENKIRNNDIISVFINEPE